VVRNASCVFFCRVVLVSVGLVVNSEVKMLKRRRRLTGDGWHHREGAVMGAYETH
jgi:hypothetical protein